MSSLLTSWRFPKQAKHGTFSDDQSIEQEDLLPTTTTTTTKTPNESESQSPQEEWHAAAYHRLRRTLIIVVLLFSSVIVVILWPWPPVESSAVLLEMGEGGGIKGIPWSKVTFEKDEKFAAPSSPESDAAWGEMMPPGDGFVVIDDPRQLHLLSEPGKDTRYGQVYDISMWHQLHCLSHMRTYMFTMQASFNRTNAQQVFDVLLAPQAEHMLHCFDYLRQAIMCAGDMTLEWPSTEPDGRRFAVNGWGIEHKCRDWDTMADYVEQHAVGKHHKRMAR